MQVADLFAKLGLRVDKQSFQAADSLMGSLRAGLGALAAGLTVNYFAGLISDTSQAADAASKTAAKVGITTEAVQELGYVAGLSGSNIDALTAGMGRLAGGLEDAAKTGKGPTADAMRTLGISMRDPAVQSRDLDAILMRVADGIAAMPNDARKTAVAMDLFGKAGKDLIPFLNEGSEGIEKLRQEARDLGIVIDSETAKSFEAFNDDQDRVKAALTGIRNEVVKALLPQLGKMAKAVVDWVKANRGLIRQRLASILQGIVAAANLVGKAISMLFTVFAVLRDNLGLVIAAMTAVGTAMLIMRLASIKAAIASALAWAAALLPFILMAAAIFALILVVEDLYRAFTGGESVFKDLYLAAKKWIDEKLGEVLQSAADRVASFLDVGGIFGARDAIKRRKDAEAGLRATEAQSADQDARLDATLEQMRREREAREAAMTPEQRAALEDAKRALAMQTQEAMLRRDDLVRPLPSWAGGTSNVQATFNLTVPPGSNEAQLVDMLDKSWRSFWDTEMRTAAAATGE